MYRESVGRVPFQSSMHPPTVSPRVSPIPFGPLTVGGSRWVSEHLPSPSHPSGMRSWRSGLYFCSPFPPSHSLRTHVAGGGLGGQRIRPGISAGSWGSKWAGETWPCSLLILCPPNFLLRAWDPFPSPSCRSGAPVLSRLHFSSPFTPPTSHVPPGCWGFLPCP